MKLEPLPKPWLDPESVSHANEMFYSAEPHEYFSMRLSLLVVAASKPRLVEDAIRAGVTYDTLTVGGSGGEPQPRAAEDDDDNARKQKQFVITETLSLLYHVSETLVRYYLAHERLAESPWIAIADEPPMDAFKRAVAQRFKGRPLTKKRRAALAKVFYGSERPRDADGVSEEEWDASLDDVELWLNHFASRFLQDAHVANAVKHGLAIQPGEPSMEVITPADKAEGRDPPLIHAKGPGVTYLEKRGDDMLWHISTKWLRPFTPAQLMADIFMATLLLQSIWQVGRARYTGKAEPVRIYWPPKFNPFMDSAESGVITNRMSMNMLYRWAYPPDLQCSDCGRKPRDGERARLSWRMYRDNDGAPHVLCPDCAKRRETTQE